MDKLLNAGLKKTKTRVEILNLLKEDFPLTAEEIFEKLKDDKIKIPSIYRNLSTFVESGIVLKSVGLDGIAYYQLNDDNHKHQIVCTNCGKTKSIDHAPVIEIEKNIEKETGFTITSHTFEFSGICEDCKNKN